MNKWWTGTWPGITAHGFHKITWSLDELNSLALEHIDTQVWTIWLLLILSDYLIELWGMISVCSNIWCCFSGLKRYKQGMSLQSWCCYRRDLSILIIISRTWIEERGCMIFWRGWEIGMLGIHPCWSWIANGWLKRVIVKFLVRFGLW